MSQENRWRQYLFRGHSEAILRQWAMRLAKFRFCRAYGGHANDGDLLQVSYGYQDVTDLEGFFSFLGMPLITFPRQPPQPEAGVGYRGDVFSAFPSLIPGTRWIEQPGRCTMADQEIFVWCEEDRINLMIGTDYRVTESDVAAAEKVEQVLEEAPLTILDPPVDDKHCICPKHYPDFFRL